MSSLPFVEEILADLRRFKECVEDGQDVDLGRDRFDLLAQLGLLERVQRSPARWMMTQAGEDAIAQPAAGEPIAWMHEDELPEGYPYDAMFPFSKVDLVRMFPVFGPPAADGTTSDKYRAELYDEVWQNARSMGYGNVTDALSELERFKLAQAAAGKPAAVVEQTDYPYPVSSQIDVPLPVGTQLYTVQPAAGNPDSSDTFYAGLYHKSSPMWHQLHELAVSKGYDHVRYAIECAPVYKCDCRGARKVGLDLEGRTMPCDCVEAANDASPAAAHEGSASEAHRNQMADTIVSLRTEIAALRRNAAAHGDAAVKPSLWARLDRAGFIVDWTEDPGRAEDWIEQNRKVRAYAAMRAQGDGEAKS